MLLAHKADPTIADQSGCTPLHKAALWGRADVVTVLLDTTFMPSSSAEGQSPDPPRQALNPNLKTSPTSCPPEHRAVSLLEAPLHLCVGTSDLGLNVSSDERRAVVEALLARGKAFLKRARTRHALNHFKL